MLTAEACMLRVQHQLALLSSNMFGPPSTVPFTPAGTSMHFPSTSPMPATPAAMEAAPAAHAYAAAAHLSKAQFGAQLFPGAHAARVVPHFPTAASELADAGLARSAQIWLEMSMTFYSAGLAGMAAGGNNQQGGMYKPTPLEASTHPPPGQSTGRMHQRGGDGAMN